MTGRTDIEMEISNQCARLIGSAIIYYNSAIMSRLLAKYETDGNAKAVALTTQIPPAARRHILLNGHYTFQNGGKMIDLDTLLAELELGWRNFLGLRLRTPLSRADAGAAGRRRRAASSRWCPSRCSRR